MPRLKEFYAWITIEEQELQHYALEYSPEGNKVTCYICSEAGKAFKVNWHDYNVQTATRGRVYIDGRSVGGKIIYAKDKNTVTKKGFRTDKNVRLPFVFSELIFTDEETACSSSTTPGEINVVITRVKMLNKQLYSKSHVAPENQAFNEKEHKGGSHNTTFGDPIVDKTLIQCHKTVPYGPPVAHFCFKYMPFDLLKARNITSLLPVQLGRPEVQEVPLVTNSSVPTSRSRSSTLVSRTSRSAVPSTSSRNGSSSTLVERSASAKRAANKRKQGVAPSRSGKLSNRPPNEREVIDLTDL